MAESDKDAKQTGGSGTSSSDSNNVILKTTGLVSSFEGEGFPTVTSQGTRMSRTEANKALKAASTTHTKLEEVVK